MQICSECLYPSTHPLGITFDSNGVCSGCRVHREKNSLDWTERSKKLSSIFDNYRSISGRNYDCVVPVSGARDSYFIVHQVKNVFGMNPLLVTYNKQYNTSVGVRNLANLRIRFDCDIMTKTVNPETVKRITRATLRRFGSIYWHCIAGQTVFPVEIAVKFKIPLIVWGAHQGVDQVGMFSHLNEVEMTRRYRKEHDLMGYEAEDLIEDFDGITSDDVTPYVYPDNQEVERVGVRGLYLNNYIRWDSRIQHEQMISQYGYESATQDRTFDFYNDVDCFNYPGVHDYLKVLKHGYGKVLDHACRDIRLGHLDRKTAVSLIREHTFLEPQNLNLFLTWIGMTENAFHYIVDQHRNEQFWKRGEGWKWQFTDPLGLDGMVNADLASAPTMRPFTITPKGESTDSEERYILIGKGTT